MSSVVFSLIVVSIFFVAVVVRKKEREKNEKELKEKAEKELREKAERELREKEKEEKWQEDIRTGKVDFNKAKDFFNNGIKLLGSEKHYEAIVQFTKAIEFNPRYSEAYHNRGIAYRKNGDIDKAIDDYKEALSLNDNNGETIYNLGLAYMGKKDFFSACSSFNGLIRSPKFYDLSEPGRIAVYINLGISKYNNARNDHEHCDAVGDWIEALTKDPNNSEAKRLIQMALQSSNSLTLKLFVRGMMEQRNLHMDGYGVDFTRETDTMNEEAQDD